MITFWCPPRCCNSSMHFELDLRVYKSQKCYKGVESLRKKLTVAHVLSREISASGKLVAMRRLCCPQCLPPVLGCEHESCKHQGCATTYKDLLTCLCPALMNSGGQHKAAPKSSKQTTHAAAPQFHPALYEDPLARKTC